MKLIDKDKIVAEIKRRIDDEMEIIKKFTHPFYATEITRCNARVALLKQLQDFLNTLEVEEVDLEEEFENFVVDGPVIGNLVNFNAAKIIATHFFELGMQQSKNDNNNEE